jgi:hypothetical protein
LRIELTFEKGCNWQWFNWQLAIGKREGRWVVVVVVVYLFWWDGKAALWEDGVIRRGDCKGGGAGGINKCEV